MWITVLLASGGSWVIKYLGYAVPERVLDRPLVRQTALFLPVALLAAIVTVQTVARGQSLVVDGRLAGLAAAVVALRLRAPFIVVVLTAAVVTASLRALGWVA